MGAFLSNLSAGLFNIALVDIAADYGRSVPATQWVVTAYLLTVSVCLPLMGAIGDWKGKRNVHNLGFFVFMLGGLCCALSPSLPVLIGFRVLQGVGASIYQANNMALVVSLFPPEKRGKALGTVSTFVAAGALIGPSLGGAILQAFSWRFNFWLLAAVAFVAWLLARRLIPKDAPAARAAPDWMGAALFAAALAGLVAGLNLGASDGWSSPAVWLLLAVFALFAALFAGRSLSVRPGQTGRSPFIPLSLFRHPSIAFGILLTIATYAAAFSTQTVLPVFLRSVMGLEPAVAGLIVMAYPAALIISAPLSGSSSDRYGSARVLLLGLGCMVAALAALGFLPSGAGLVFVIASVVLLGTAMGMITSPNNSLVMSFAPRQSLGTMSSMIALCRNLGMMFGAAVGGMMMATPAGGLSDAAGVTGQLTRGLRGGYWGMSAVVLAFLLAYVAMSRAGAKRGGAAPAAGSARTPGVRGSSSQPANGPVPLEK
nr:MFS transporter [Cohnella zeiphila]